MPPECAGCGHPWEAHQHYRGGTECAMTVPDGTWLNGDPAWRPCRCVRYRRPSPVARALRLVARLGTARWR